MSQSDANLKSAVVERVQPSKVSWSDRLGLPAAIAVCAVVTTIVIAVPIAQIIFGSLYIKQCPVEPRIPIYLIVAGTSMFVFLAAAIITIVREKSLLWLVIRSIIAAFCLAWCITGIVWTIGVDDHVQSYDPQMPSTYCHGSLLICTWTTLLVSGAFLLGYLSASAKRSK